MTANTYTLKEGQYLSDLNLRFKHGVTLLEVPTGGGKSETALNYKTDLHTVVAVPLLSIIENKQRDDVQSVYGKGSAHGGFTFGGVGDIFADNARLGKISLCTYDSLCKMTKNLMANTVVFWDEAQYSIDAQGYRPRLAPAFSNMRQNAETIVLMGGTNYTEAILPFVDHYIRVERSERQTREITLVIEDKRTRTAVDFTFKALQRLSEEQFGVALVENKAHITALKDKLIASGEFADGEIMTYVSPESDLTASNTEEALRMIQTGEIPEQVKVILWTSAALVGADLRHPTKTPLALFHGEWLIAPEAIAQMCGRFRDAPNVPCIVHLSQTHYTRHFALPSAYDEHKALARLERSKERARAYLEHYGTLAGADGEARLVMAEDGSDNLLGCMKHIQNDVLRYTNHKELYNRFDIQVVGVLGLNPELKLDVNATIDREELFNDVLALDAHNFDIDLIEQILLLNDRAKVYSLPKPIRGLIRLHREHNADVLKHLWMLKKVTRRYTDALAYRITYRRKESYPSINAMLTKADEAVVTWHLKKPMRELFLRRFEGKAVGKDALIKALNMQQIGGSIFYSKQHKAEVVGSLNKFRAKVTSVLNGVVRIKQRESNGSTLFVIDRGFPDFVIDNLSPEWVASKITTLDDSIEQTKVFDRVNYEFIVPKFENLSA